jgi:ligand-binding SRPBCC domain-containing protein
MPLIHLTSFISAPAERVFDLSRSIDLHKKSMSQKQETAVSGMTTGLAQYDDTVTWKAKHLFKFRILKVRFTEMNRPYSFTTEMLDGDFRSMKHEHHFKQVENGTLMIDLFQYELPYSVFGVLAARLYLNNYLKKLLVHRNGFIRLYSESEKWKFVLA